MIVVADTTPIISLLKIGRLNVLQKLFGEVVIPYGVYYELTSNAVHKEEILAIQNADFLTIGKKLSKGVVELFRKSTGLDLGESEALILSENSNADILLMDEMKGRKIAKLMNMNVMSTIGILIKSYQTGLMNKKDMEEAIQILKSTGRFISEKVYAKIYEIMKD